MTISHSDRILITGGAGFLGGFVIDNLKRRGYSNIATLRRKDYDLTVETEVERLYKDFKPAVVMHLAAEVGGIGANRDNPGRFFFANMACKHVKSNEGTIGRASESGGIATTRPPMISRSHIAISWCGCAG